MTNKQANKILGLLGKLKTNDYHLMHLVVDFLSKKDNILLVQKVDWNDTFKNKNRDIYPLDLSSKDVWITYDRCIDFTFKPSDNRQILLEVTNYDGEMLNGFRKNIRWTATIILPINFLKNITDKIQSKLEDLAEEAYELHLETKKRKYIDDFISETLKINV